MAAPLDTESRTAWISQGFEILVDRVRKDLNAVHFDVLIIGSGYGGAVAAATFAGRTGAAGPITVAVLERGQEYLPGSFPTGLGELPRFIRRDGNRQGLFDVRLGPEVNTVIASGVGGGSLINAGVMEVPRAKVFRTGWPAALSDLAAWRPYFRRAAEMVGARIGGAPNTILGHPDGVPQKFTSVAALAPAGTFRPAAISVAMQDRTNAGNVALRKCVRCGDCATGCNFGAKDSLDTNLLVTAQQAGADIFSGATVLDIEQDGASWIANAVYTDAALRKRDGERIRVRARKIILCAGTLGSTEILMRSHKNGLAVAEAMLGRRCSTNGDMLAADFATGAAVNTVADERRQPSQRAIGPTITGIIDLRDSADVLIEEISVPASLRVAFTEIFATVNTLHGLKDADFTSHTTGFPIADGYAAPDGRVTNTAVYAVMGDDGAAGRIKLDGDPTDAEDGIARMRWKRVEALPVFDDGIAALSGLTGATGGRIIANPVWKLLPRDLEWLMQNKRGPVTTVHPLGGLVMADDSATGVVDAIGRVYRPGAAAAAVHDGLAVLDGSIVPTALGTNPALTIAAVALRASEALAAEWGYAAAPPAPAGPPLQRPVFRHTDVAAAPASAEVEVIERLVGPVRLTPANAGAATHVVELTLVFRPKRAAELHPSHGGDGTLQVSSALSDPVTRSMIRIFDKVQWDGLERSWDPPALREQKLDAIAEFRAPLTGTLRVFERQATSAVGRILRAGGAWLLNRGLRDIWQARRYGDGGPGLGARLKSGLAIASRAGEIHRFIYDLRIGAPLAGSTLSLGGSTIRGTKRFTYERRGNPWRQLMEVTLEDFPGLDSARPRILSLDLGYLARIGVPLFRITRESDGVGGIAELAGFLGYFFRLLLGIHIWSFRAPDEDHDPANDVVDFNPPARLTVTGGTVQAQVVTRAVASKKPDLGRTDTAGEVRLTRYPKPGTTRRPVVMLHGYSAGGTTFAHRAVNPNFASHLWDAGRDVWIADLRTSPAFATTTATKAWSFDQIGTIDVPLAIDAAAAESIDGKVDVVAHCMGTIVFSIAALQGLLKDKVERVAFTQVGPLIVFSPVNVFRAYATRYLIDFLPDHYEFSPKNPTVADDLWDRVLATLPYPVEEFDYENPLLPWKETPWTRTRHRMDALYGRDFNVANMEPQMLRFIDEHFGALNLRTVSTTLHFARYALMTDFHGQNNLVSRDRFAANWPFPTFSVHGEANGLAHVATLDRMRQILDDAGVNYLIPFTNPGAGHQDALIGTKRGATFRQVQAFLDAPTKAGGGAPATAKVAYPPWIGPILTEETIDGANALVARVGAAPSFRAAEAVVMLRVQLSGDRILRPDNPALPWDDAYVLSHMAVYISIPLSANRWDAFEVPPPGSMPDPAHPGNALLMLIVYDEAEQLIARGLGYFMVDKGEVFRFSPRGGREDRKSDALSYKSFLALRDAALNLLNLAAPGMPDDADGGPARLVLRGQREIVRNGLDPASLRRITGIRSLEPQFGPDPATSDAVLETVVDQDRNLMDGVIPDPQPAPAANTTRFTLGSCQYPGGLFDEPAAFASYRRIVDRLRGPAQAAPRFLLFVGDQVYVDPTAGLYDPGDLDDVYRLPYEKWLRQPAARSALRMVPSFMLLDDHEIADNWEPVASPDEVGNAELRDLGVKAFEKYQRGIGPGPESFTFDGFGFFLLDTRTARQHRKVGAADAAQLFSTKPPGNNTMQRLKDWLLAGTAPKFVVTPALFLPRHRRAVQRDRSLDGGNLSAIHSDGWDGYPDTLREVLLHIARNKIPNVVFLSGDEHRASIATAELRDATGALLTRLHSIHTAAMRAPFPFANAVPEDIVESEVLQIPDGNATVFCSVEAIRPAPGDGPTFLAVRNEAGLWKLDCEFADGVVRTLAL